MKLLNDATLGHCWFRSQILSGNTWQEDTGLSPARRKAHFALESLYLMGGRGLNISCLQGVCDAARELRRAHVEASTPKQFPAVSQGVRKTVEDACGGEAGPTLGYGVYVSTLRGSLSQRVGLPVRAAMRQIARGEGAQRDRVLRRKEAR